jgi:hypothetical protein
LANDKILDGGGGGICKLLKISSIISLDIQTVKRLLVNLNRIHDYE